MFGFQDQSGLWLSTQPDGSLGWSADTASAVTIAGRHNARVALPDYQAQFPDRTISVQLL